MQDAMPTKGFFPAYVKYAHGQTDAPDIFHLGTALAMFSAAAAKTTVLKYPDGGWMPLHLWVLLVGPSGDRKTTSIDVGGRVMIANPADPRDRGGVSFPVFGLSRSPEATFDVLSRSPSCLLLHPEASNFFQALRKPWWGQSAGFLSEVYDGRTMKRVLSGKVRSKGGKRVWGSPVEIVVKDPRVAFLGGIAPDLISWCIRARDRITSPLSRMLPLWGERVRFVELPGRPNFTTERRLRKLFLQSVPKAEEAVTFDWTAWEWYKAWARQTDRETRNFVPDKAVMMRRLLAHVLRVAALYRLSSPDEDEVDVMQRALALGERVKMSILKLPPVKGK